MNSLKILFISAFLVMTTFAIGQNALISKANSTTFFSKAPLEDITATNDQTTAALDLSKNEIVVKMLIKHFDFENSLMQEHFNENYMESDKFPSAVFKGKISSDQVLDVNNKGTYPVKVNGTITLHGVEQPLESTAIIEILEDEVKANAEFILKPADFKIKIPKMVVKNIAENIEVSTALAFTK